MTALVTDFGAIGDGTTDVTHALEAAVASLPDTGGEVLFPAGDDVHGDVLTVGPTGARLRLGRCHPEATATRTEPVHAKKKKRIAAAT